MYALAKVWGGSVPRGLEVSSLNLVYLAQKVDGFGDAPATLTGITYRSPMTYSPLPDYGLTARVHAHGVERERRGGRGSVLGRLGRRAGLGGGIGRDGLGLA